MKVINAIFVIFLLILADSAFMLGKYRSIILKKILHQDQNLFVNFSTQNYTSIELELSGQKMIFDKNATQSAELKYIDSMLETIKNLSRNTLVSENPAKAKIFAVDNTGLQIIVKNKSQTTAHLYIGKRGQNYSSNFYRKNGENNVYQSDKLLDTIFIPQTQSP